MLFAFVGFTQKQTGCHTFLRRDIEWSKTMEHERDGVLTPFKMPIRSPQSGNRE